LKNGKIHGVEALVRWRSENGENLLPPEEFLGLAEETGLIVPIGAWVLDTACAQAAQWRQEGIDLTVAVNISARQFRHATLVSTVQSALEKSNLPADRLELEVTEFLVMSDTEFASRTLNALKAIGVQVAIDNFGTAYSSIASLKKMPIEHLKIDRAFIRNSAETPDDEAIIRAMVQTAHTLSMKVTTEGVETEFQRGLLDQLKCDRAQGFLFATPQDANAMGALLRKAVAAPEKTPPDEESSS
jgi:EAL domain-containing protein (putative c-di-GMP-specific phosphodiesterase class I)